jgi:hypothetical protein
MILTQAEAISILPRTRENVRRKARQKTTSQRLSDVGVKAAFSVVPALGPLSYQGMAYGSTVPLDVFIHEVSRSAPIRRSTDITSPKESSPKNVPTIRWPDL